jgi:hypothetical protein
MFVVEVDLQIRLIRGHRVMLDSDLAALYGVPTKVFNQAVRRNLERFPADFLLQLTEEEEDSLRSQSVTLKAGRGRHRKYPPMAFTEHVVRAFVKLRQTLASTSALARRLEALEKSVSGLDSEMRKEFTRVYKAILKLMGPPPLDQ